MDPEIKNLLERIAVALEGINEALHFPKTGDDGKGIAEILFDAGLRIGEGTDGPTLVEAIRELGGNSS